MKSIGEKIYRLRKAKGLSQEELGFEIGVSRQSVSKWEADFAKPNMENIKQLCEVFNVTANYFFSEDENGFSSLNGTQGKEDNSALPITELNTNKDNQSNKKFLLTIISITTILNILSIVFIIVIAASSKREIVVNTNGVYLVLFILLCVVLGISVITEIIFSVLYIKQNNHKLS